MAYRLYFSSSVDFEKIYSESKLVSIVTKNLVCSIGDDTGFNIDRSMPFEFRGRIVLQPAQTVASSFNYSAYGDFYENLRGGTEVRSIDVDELHELIGKRSHVDCKVIMTIYGSRPYYSSTMRVPTKELLKATRTVMPSPGSSHELRPPSLGNG